MSFSRTAGEAFPPVRCILGTRRCWFRGKKVRFMVKKTFLRSVKARTRDDLLEAIGQAEGLISGVLVGAWFAACNYIV